MPRLHVCTVHTYIQYLQCFWKLTLIVSHRGMYRGSIWNNYHSNQRLIFPLVLFFLHTYIHMIKPCLPSPLFCGPIILVSSRLRLWKEKSHPLRSQQKDYREWVRYRCRHAYFQRCSTIVNNWMNHTRADISVISADIRHLRCTGSYTNGWLLQWCTWLFL